MTLRIGGIVAVLAIVGMSNARAVQDALPELIVELHSQRTAPVEPRACMETWRGAELKCASHIYQAASEYLDAGRFDEAIVRFSQVLTIQPYLFAYNGRGAAYAKKGDYFRARRDYVRALGISQIFPENWYNLAWIDYKEKRYKDALDNVMMALKLRSTAPEYYDLQAMIYRALGDNRRAALSTASSWLLRAKESLEAEKKERTTQVQ